MLRAFSTDTKTPFYIVEASVESTKALFPRVICWVTGVEDTDNWREYVWKLSNLCDEVLIQRDNNWWWFCGISVPINVANTISAVKGEVCWLHDDLILPAGKEWEDWYAGWRASDSNVINFQAVQCWKSLDVVRLNYPGSVTPHSFISKGIPQIHRHPQFLPGNARSPQLCPYPIRHAKYAADPEVYLGRKGTNDVRRGWIHSEAETCEYVEGRPWSEWRTMIKG
jgi:hypothetical protein